MQKAALSVKEVASLLGISSNTAYSLIRQGIIPALKLGPRRIVIPIHALEKMLSTTNLDING